MSTNTTIKPLSELPLDALADHFGTPLYVIDHKTLVANAKQFTTVFDQLYPNYQVLFAGKAGLNLGILNALHKTNIGVDVVSLGELYTAVQSDIPAEKILLHGNNKSRDELQFAIANDVRIVIDNLCEVETLKQMAEEVTRPINVLLRINPEIEAHTHEFIQTGQKESKFGIDQSLMLSTIRDLVDTPNINFLGLHSHIGSQIFDISPYVALVDRMIDWLGQIKSELHLELPQLNLGGGFGIKYINSDDPKPISEFLEAMLTRLNEKLAEHGLQRPLVIIEPGRSIIANAGVTIYDVGAEKQAGDTHYLFIDGGMADNIRPLLYQSEHVIELANRDNEPTTQTYTIAGKFCESGDKIAKDVALPKARIGDRLVVYGTGAYNYSMASNYNRFCKPALVLYKDGKAACLVKRETLDDLMAHDQVEPDFVEL